MIRRSRPRGYLVALMAICAALLTIAYLRLSAGSAAVHDSAELTGAKLAAHYAAESGLLTAQNGLSNFTGKRPNPGVQFSGQLPHSKSRFKVEVRADYQDDARFIMRSIGTAEAENGRAVTVSIDAKVLKDKKGHWSVHSRTLVE